MRKIGKSCIFFLFLRQKLAKLKKMPPQSGGISLFDFSKYQRFANTLNVLTVALLVTTVL